ncbi:MAG: two pore domain potassium channel family protein [Dehalococcoidia bacterium]|nr:two pore domain potassium channel family protein [Dehalococcoidia bacterium]
MAARRLPLLVMLLLLNVLGAAAWYRLVEGFTALDAIFQSVITISTVGFGEVEPLDRSGKLFTIAYILTGAGLMLYTVTAVVEALIAGSVAKALGTRREARVCTR